MAFNQVTPLRTHIIYTFGSLFAQFLLGLLQQIPPAMASPSTPQRMLEIKRWLDRHFTEEISIPQLAEKANLSSYWFSTVFRNTVGMSPKAYLITLRLKHAAYLLDETTLSITEIAYRIGFNDLATLFVLLHRIIIRRRRPTVINLSKRILNWPGLTGFAAHQFNRYAKTAGCTPTVR